MTLLETRGLSVAYGGVRANSDVCINVEPGSFVGLIGPNGAGKTTFIEAITGFTRPTEGAVMFDGDDVTSLPPHERARRGLSRTFQTLELFEDLTVAENLRAAIEHPVWYTFLADMVRPRRGASVSEHVHWALSTVGLEATANALPTDLSHGQRKLVGVARALVSRPKLLLLDEPAAGLDTAESLELGAELRRLIEIGITILMIDHDMGLVMSVCDHVYVLDFGTVIAQGSPAAIRSNPDVVTAYLGESAGEEQAREADAVSALEHQTIDARAINVEEDG